jgi:hypothetical protein
MGGGVIIDAVLSRIKEKAFSVARRPPTLSLARLLFYIASYSAWIKVSTRSWIHGTGVTCSERLSAT